MAKDRNIKVRHHSSDGVKYTRSYSSLENAIATSTRMALIVGRVKDVWEIYHAVTSMQIGTIRVTAQGSLKTGWVWDGEDVKA
jgi:hypothetical protein